MVPGDRAPDAALPLRPCCPCCRSHLLLDQNDPATADKLSVQRLRRGIARDGAIPSAAHGAPSTADESRETLGRLKRMAGFEAQDFDPAVRGGAGALRSLRRGWMEPPV